MHSKRIPFKIASFKINSLSIQRWSRPAGISYGMALLALCLVSWTLAAQAKQPESASATDTNTAGSLIQTRVFTPGQVVYLDMNVGEINIVRSPNEHQIQLVIKPDYDAGQAEMQSWVRQFDVSSTEAHIRLHLPKNTGNEHDGAKVTLYLPSQETLHAKLGVGQMTVGDVRGDKELHVGVGQLDIRDVNPEDYGNVVSTTNIGDVKDGIFQGKQSGWLGNSETAQGTGKYRIHAYVGIGEINFKDSRV